MRQKQVMLTAFCLLPHPTPDQDHSFQSALPDCVLFLDKKISNGRENKLVSDNALQGLEFDHSVKLSEAGGSDRYDSTDETKHFGCVIQTQIA